MAMPQLIAGQNPTPQPPTSQQPLSPKAQRDLVVGKIEAHWTGDLDGMIERRYIRVATTYNKTSYFIDRGVQRGHVYESMQLFVEELNAKLKIKNIGVDVVFIPMSREELLPAIVEGRADVAAAALTITSARQQLVDFSPPTRTGVDEIIVTGPGAPTLASSDDLAGQHVFVRKSSAYYENLVSLSAQLKAKGKPEIILKPAPEALEDDDVLEMVNAGLVKITVVDNYVAEFWKQLLPGLVLHPGIAVAKGGVLGVAMRPVQSRLSADGRPRLSGVGPRSKREECRGRDWCHAGHASHGPEVESRGHQQP